MDAETVQLLQEVSASLRWARFGGAEFVPASSSPQRSEPRPQNRASQAPVAAPPQPRQRRVEAPAVTILAHASGSPKSRLTVLCMGVWGDTAGACWRGPEGELLARMVTAMNFDPQQVHAVTLVRVPDGETVAADERPPSLSQQLKACGSDALLVFGEEAARLLLRTNQPIDTLRGQWRTLGGRPTMITYGPSVLLQMPMFKAMAWKDMQDVMAKLKL
jgi:uracil-DNA glycosylase family 4